ncbi:P-loop NTPase fold protein [Flavobacterium flavigenum]|uniref:P-loop NTPase fold protein n=1 Tax=Flavobacterium flavigenum TaxID=3003258 RepID=UPI002482202D|nr:P-loop NTPase fold protein [Flavobacterium flavigenum]
MKQLNDIIDFYLTHDSNYAVMITGDWGIGKTYYFRNTLAQKIEQIPTFANAAKKYKPVIISLFGLSTIEEIQTEIFLSIYPLLKNKSVKLGASIGKALIKGVLKLHGLDEYGKIFSDVETNKNDWINFNEIVVCFDDFERLSGKLSIDELIGFINSLVETESIKVIILANEDKIVPKNYFTLKEKIVGNSIEFIQDISSAFDSLIKDKFSGFPKYLKFLEEHKKFIIETFCKQSNNLRVLIFILTYFQTIFSSYENQLSSADILRKHEKEIMPRLIKFAIFTGLLYKMGEISFKKRDKIEEVFFIKRSDQYWNNADSDGNKGKDRRDKVEKVMDKIYKNDLYVFFPSIYDFLTGGTVFNPDGLIFELKTYLHVHDNDISPAYDVLSKLNYPKVFVLNDSDYKFYTKQMLDYAKKGDYSLEECLVIFSFSVRFNNPLNLDFDSLESGIIKGLKKGAHSFSYAPSLSYNLAVDSSSPHKTHLINIRNAAVVINEKLGIALDNRKFKEVENLYKKDFEKFYSQMSDKNVPISREAVLKTFNVREFYNFFLKSNGDVKWKIINMLKERYPVYPSSVLKPEISFLEELLSKADKKARSLSAKGISLFLYNEFSDVLKEAVTRIREEN